MFNPVTIGQRMYYQALNDPRIPLVIVKGPAGTGKTMIASKVGSQQVSTGRYENLVITRPVIGNPHGYLPGTLDAKMKPWVRPMSDHIQISKRVETIPLTYMRGLTLMNSFVIADEMQNSTQEQMKMLLTRIGKNTKLVVTGDPDQSDIGHENGFDDLVTRVRRNEDDLWKLVELTQDDIQRSELVKRILGIY
jgi:phosphate starvation-inducible PhoH-like protein